MELLRGETLGERLARSGRMSTDEALPIVRQVAAALDAPGEAGCRGACKVPGHSNPPKQVGTSSHFQAGQNVLTIVVNNLPNSPTGLVAGGSITADAGRCR